MQDDAGNWVRSLADSDASCGGKAVGLARLIAGGLRVPEGFVIDVHAFRSLVGEPAALDEIGHSIARAADRLGELPDALVAAVDTRLAKLSGPFAVRSSAAIEDGATSAAPGVFASFVRVPADEVWSAIRAVWTSALAPLAASYARGRGNPAMSVIVQQFVDGNRATIYTRPPGVPEADEVWIQRDQRVSIAATSDGISPGRDVMLTKHERNVHDPIVELALRAETAIAASRGADVELVIANDAANMTEEARGGELWVVQARPIVHPITQTRSPPPPSVITLLADGRVWTWDIAHNPDPLSTAQADLVGLVERAQIAPWSLCVCGGFLYTAPRITLELPVVTSRADLDARAAQIESKLASALEVPRSLAHAIEQYLAFYRIWATELVPLIQSARHALSPELLRGSRPSAVEMTLLAAARGELEEDDVVAFLGRLAPAWDVAVPTFGERPGVIRHAIARAVAALARVGSSPTPARDDSLGARVGSSPTPARDDSLGARQPSLRISTSSSVDDSELARGVADLAERDDRWFALAQWRVRHEILALAFELDIDPDDAFWLHLEELALLTTIDVDRARRRAAAARAAAARAAGWSMPLVVGGEPSELGPVLVGTGSGGQVTGRVVRFASLASAISVSHGDIVVTRAVTPALAVIVVGCAAIVSETGGLLDHGAALARELGIPCIVGCRDAWSLLVDGMIVTVDGNAGTVTR